MSSATILIGISIALICGLISNRLIKLIHLPNVTAYLIVGILIGPYLFSLINPNLGGILSTKEVESFGIIVDIALGFIAFSIGAEFKLSTLKKLGKGIMTITILQSMGALLFVDVALIIICSINNSLQANLPLILVLGAVATATAPAATLMVIKQYKAKGELTDTLLPVVAADDAVGLILFSISFSIAQTIAKSNAGISDASISFTSLIGMPLLEIFVSLLIGSIIGIILTLSMKAFKSRANRLICMIASIFLGVALCELSSEYLNIEISSLLTCMMIGALFCNLRDDAIQILDGIDRWTPALFMLFFILSGAELNFSVMGNITVIGICAVYLISRSLGKYFGAYFGAEVTHASKKVRNYLGLTLLPQAGVAIGMARSSSSIFRSIADSITSTNLIGANYLNNIGDTITAVVLTATLIYELFGPVITKVALTKAGEIDSSK